MCAFVCEWRGRTRAMMKRDCRESNGGCGGREKSNCCPFSPLSALLSSATQNPGGKAVAGVVLQSLVVVDSISTVSFYASAPFDGEDPPFSLCLSPSLFRRRSRWSHRRSLPLGGAPSRRPSLNAALPLCDEEGKEGAAAAATTPPVRCFVLLLRRLVSPPLRGRGDGRRWMARRHEVDERISYYERERQSERVSE